jgi:uncharacterized membrane protein (UPF0127 family)
LEGETMSEAFEAFKIGWRLGFIFVVIIIVLASVPIVQRMITNITSISKWDTVNITVAGENITVYYADTVDKMSEGYKNKGSYDFADKGAVGILFPLYKLGTTKVCFTMRDVNLDLILVVARKTHFEYEIVEKIYMPMGSSDTCIDTYSAYIKYETIAIEIDPSKSDLFPLGAVITLPPDLR